MSEEIAVIEPRLVGLLWPTWTWKPWPEKATVPSYVIAPGRKWYCMSGHFTPAFDRIKPHASKWLDAPRPFFVMIHSMPILSFFNRLIWPFYVIGCLHRYWKLNSRWSCKFSPTPGRSCITWIPALFNFFLHPTPETCRICGDPIDPALKIISLWE